MVTAEEIAIKLTEHDNKIKVSEYRIKDLEEQNKVIQELALSVKELAITMKNMIEEQKDQGKRISSIEKEPGDNYRQIKWYLLTSIATFIIGYLANFLL